MLTHPLLLLLPLLTTAQNTPQILADDDCHIPQKRQVAQDTIPMPPYEPLPFLPPPWTPESGVRSPYPPIDIESPLIDDSGRAEMLDNGLLYRNCPSEPALLDCSQCPLDTRCRFPPFEPEPEQDQQIDVNDEVNDKVNACGLHTCTSDASSPSTFACGENAKCVRGYCVCDRGWKADGAIRGLDGLQAITVWIDTGRGCDVRCEGLGCKDVQQGGACFQRVENGVAVPAEME
jgi:hypothetical protein